MPAIHNDLCRGSVSNLRLEHEFYPLNPCEICQCITLIVTLRNNLVMPNAGAPAVQFLGQIDGRTCQELIDRFLQISVDF